jgi:hypothetical protein
MLLEGVVEQMKVVDNETQALLRIKGLINEQEIVHVQGDLLVVVNVVENTRRILGPAVNFLNESVNKRILKG